MFRAGDRITAARLSWDMQAADLATHSPSFPNVYDPWAGSTLTFPAMGVPVKVRARLTLRGSKLPSTDAFIRVRVGISFDNGTTWIYGNQPYHNVSSGSGSLQRTAMTATNFAQGTPVTNLLVRAECFASSITSVTFTTGFITAKVMPQ